MTNKLLERIDNKIKDIKDIIVSEIYDIDSTKIYEYAKKILVLEVERCKLIDEIKNN